MEGSGKRVQILSHHHKRFFCAEETLLESSLSL